MFLENSYQDKHQRHWGRYSDTWNTSTTMSCSLCANERPLGRLGAVHRSQTTPHRKQWVVSQWVLHGTATIQWHAKAHRGWNNAQHISWFLVHFGDCSFLLGIGTRCCVIDQLCSNTISLVCSKWSTICSKYFPHLFYNINKLFQIFPICVLSMSAWSFETVFTWVRLCTGSSPRLKQ